MMIYIIIKKSDVTTAMLNRSTSKCTSTCPEFVVNNPWWYFFPDDIITVLEVPFNIANQTNIFDNYTWYSWTDAYSKIQEFEASQV